MVPWRPSKSWRAPRTAPSTVPSIFTTPVLSISPTIFIPDAITDNPVSGRGASFRIGTFSVVGFVKIDISTYGGGGRTIEDVRASEAREWLWWCRAPVSYTDLRAHETPEHLVCRLLLEK